MTVDLESRLFLNGVFYSHGEERFKKYFSNNFKKRNFESLLKRISIWFDRGNSKSLQLICYDCLKEENAVYQSKGSTDRVLFFKIKFLN